MSRPPVSPAAAPSRAQSWIFPLLLLLFLGALWWALSTPKVVPEAVFPSPRAVALGFVETMRGGRLLDDIVASLFRATCGFLLALVLGVPLGLWLGLAPRARAALLPGVNFGRSLSPLAWVPFAIFWFGIGDAPAIFLIFLGAFFPLCLSALAAVATIPGQHFRVAHDYGLRGRALWSEVVLPAALPQLLTALRVTAGLSWLVLVAAEMIAGRDGLGYLVWDARNGLRPDLLVVAMIVIGCIGVLIDQIMLRLMRAPGVRWAYDR